MYLQKQFSFFWHSFVLSSFCLAISIPVLGQEIPNTNASEQSLSLQKTLTTAIQPTTDSRREQDARTTHQFNHNHSTTTSILFTLSICLS